MRPVLAAAARLVLATAVALAAPVRGARAQQPAPGGPDACVNAARPDSMPAPRAPSSSVLQRDTAHVALRILASATADEVRFVGSPKVCVRLTGDAQLDSVHVLARRNLATPVVSGTTYRNVYIAVEILGRLNADCIASRITGAPADSASAGRCASLDAAARAGAGPP